MTSSTSPGRVALVLGSGGIVGGAFHAGVLKALNDAWGIDARRVDLIVGTSAGSIVGTLAAAGMHPNDMFRRETGQPLSPGGQQLMARARRGRPPKPDPRTSVGRPVAPEVLWRAALRPWSVSMGGVAAALLPRGTAPTTHVASLVNGLLDGTWPRCPQLRVCAVEVSSARRVVFDGDGPATPSEAVAASCAVPAVFAPASIEGREYYDGCVHSANNLDVVGNQPFDLVVVSAPLSSSHPSTTEGPWAAYRSFVRWQTDRERRSLPAGTRVEIVAPAAKDLEAMGNNMLNVGRRPAVAVQAHATALAQFDRRS
jgi:NTE family protein